MPLCPRDPKPGTAFRDEIVALNQVLATYADQNQVFYMDIGECAPHAAAIAIAVPYTPLLR